MAQAGYTPISLYYSTTAAAVPTAGNLVAGELAINITDGKLYYENNSGVVTLLASSTTVTNSFSAGTTGFTPSTATTGAVTLAGTLITSNGGTGLSSYTAGDLSYYASGTALTKLAIGTAGQFLTSTGTAPQWSTLSGVAVTTFSAGTTGFTPSSATSGAVTLAGTLATTNGGTGLTSFTANGVVYASSTSALATGSALIFTGTNLGVGVNPTNAKLEVAASTGEVFRADASGGAFRIIADQTNVSLNGGSNVINYVNGSEVGRFTSTGLGIGTSSPAYKLHISGSGAQAAQVTSTSASASLILQNFTGSGNYAYIQYNGHAGSGLQFYDTANVAARMTLDSSGNLGLGVTPSAWNSVIKAIQIGRVGNGIYGQTNNNTTNITSNAYFDSVGWKYGATDTASYYSQFAGAHTWYNAPSGTAGNAITFTQAMTLDASGNLGVGTTSPSSFNLIVNSPHAVIGTGSTSAPGLTLYGTTSSAPVIAFADGTTGSEQYRGYIQYNHGADALLFATAGSERARIDSSGNFGIGTTSVPALLNVGGNLSSTYNSAGATGSFTKIGFTNVYSNASAIHSAIQATNDGTNTTGLAFLTSSTGNNGTEVGRFTSAGRLGIGTSSPQYRLSLGGIGGRNFAVYDDSTAGGVASGFGVDLSGTSYELSAWVGSPGGGNGTFTWGQVNTTGGAFSEKMRLNSSGNLLVGTAFSPQVSAGSTGVINGIASSTSGAAIAASLPASATGTGIRVQSVTSAGTGWNYFVGSSGNGSTLTTNNIFIYGNGDIQNTNNSYAGISDIKLKENIVDATPKLASLMQVKVRNYNFIGGTKKQIGVIAQELETVFPAMVEETTDKDMEGNDLGTTTKSVKYSVFVPMLIKAMQEQQAIIESLKARLDAANL